MAGAIASTVEAISAAVPKRLPRRPDLAQGSAAGSSSDVAMTPRRLDPAQGSAADVEMGSEAAVAEDPLYCPLLYYLSLSAFLHATLRYSALLVALLLL